VLPYKALFVAAHYMGAVIPLAVVWALGDVALAIVIWPNLIALLFLTPVVVEETKSYFDRKPYEGIATRRAAARGD
jgi:AGCS family alanine or glycine:cation symporter